MFALFSYLIKLKDWTTELKNKEIFWEKISKKDQIFWDKILKK